MDTRKKLGEAGHYMGELRENEQDPTLFNYSMSAFLHAWRGVLDVMLHDFAEYYSLGFSREDLIECKGFERRAGIKKCTEGVKFIHWWLKKQEMLRKNPLWSKRNLSTHGGYLGMTEHVYYLDGSGATSGSVSFYFAQAGVSAGSSGPVPLIGSHAVIQPYYASKRLEFKDIPGKNALDVCRNAYSEMEKIVEEAEKEFKLTL